MRKILTGDLNTLSPLDEGSYNAAGTMTLLQTDQRLTEKFLTRQQDGTFRMDFRPMQVLLEAGLEDFAGEMNKGEGACRKDASDLLGGHTVPTGRSSSLARRGRFFCP